MALRSSTTAVAPGAPAVVSVVRERAETLSYVALAVALGALLVSRVQQLDGFFLDEWLYVHGAEFMWDNLPSGPFEVIPEWTRGPQRLHTVLLAAIWGPLDPSTAYTVSHLVNVALLVSGIWPAALLARRVIDEPVMRVLAVALAVVVPWLIISANLLTENLAFPLFLWSVWAIVAAADGPGWWPQLRALALIAAVTLCRLNLAVMFIVLVVAVVAGEIMSRRSAAEGRFRLREALRRRAPTVAATALGLLAVAVIARDGGSRLGAYGGFASTSFFDAVWGSTADDSGRAMLTNLRSLAGGSFVFPLVLGLAAALAGARGRLGKRFVIPAITTLGSFVGVLAVVSVWTGVTVFEERYVFYVYAPVAILAVALMPQLARAVPEIAVAGAIVLLAMAEGILHPGNIGVNFFSAPAGAFWTRVVDHRIRSFENDVLGVLPGAGGGWLLLAIGVAGLVIVALVSARRVWLRSAVAVGLGLCAVAQVLVLQYDYDKLLNGTPQAPGGLALSADRSLDRDGWIDDALPDAASAAIVPALASPQAPYGDTERQQFWNKSLDASVVIRYAFVPTSVPPGFETISAGLGQDGVATWEGTSYDWLVAQPNDPRVQFSGTEVARSDSAPLALYKLDLPATAVWTGQGVETDGATLAGVDTVMTLNRRVGNDVRAVTLTFRAPAELPGDVRWTIRRPGGRRVASGKLTPGAERTVQLDVPRCRGECPNDVWQLRTAGAIAQLQAPYLGTPPPPRPVRLFLTSAVLAH